VADHEARTGCAGVFPDLQDIFVCKPIFAPGDFERDQSVLTYPLVDRVPVSKTDSSIGSSRRGTADG
jgi:hypothetical protein